MTQELILGLSQQAQSSLQRTFLAVSNDKLSWKPLENGRAALDLFGEAAQTASKVAEILETRGATTFSREFFSQMRLERANWDKETALARFETGNARFLTALKNLDESELAMPVRLEIGEGMTLPLAGWALMVYRTYISRFAQINYIQTLYGDFDPH